MQFLYNGGCENLQVDSSDVLELMAAANFFQLDGLLQYCEVQCSTMIDLDNIVSMYIHAKVRAKLSHSYLLVFVFLSTSKSKINMLASRCTVQPS